MTTTGAYYRSIDRYHEIAEASHADLAIGGELLEPFVLRDAWIIDVAGGTEFNAELLGIDPARYIAVQLGDARSMAQFADKQFDVVFSNSVIEHLETFADQQRMANEVRRVGKAYFIQTPNFHFPIEPDFVTPFLHWLPASLRVFLLRRMRLGWYEKTPDRQEAERIVREFRLLSARELRGLFPEATIRRERFLGLAKSLIAMYVPLSIQ